MALIERALIWVAYAVCLAILVFIAGIFVFIYQKPSERTVGVTAVCFVSVFALLATLLLLPVDVALVSSTTNRKFGAKKDWADPDTVEAIIDQLRIVYYFLYSLDAVLCLLVVPFTFFWYEEYDEVATEEGSQTLSKRFWGALKYTIGFLVVALLLFLIGFFYPVQTKARNEHRDFPYFKNLLTENQGERALNFSVGVLVVLGTCLYCIYTAPGLALLPITLIKSAPRVSAPQLAATNASALAENRERQRQLEGRNEGRQGGLDARDRRELEALIREERTLQRRERLAAENSGEGHFLLRIWNKLEAIFRPLKLIGGLLLLVVVLVIFGSMLVTCIDKIRNSVCRYKCGYLMGEAEFFQPVNWLLTFTSKAFPIDYIIFLLLSLLFFSASVVGIGTIGIRFLWITIFRIRKGQTSPNAMLMATVLLTLMVLAMNYSLSMIVAPQYATFGAQTFCDRLPRHPGEQPNCTDHLAYVKPCSERTDNPISGVVCTPTVMSTFINRTTLNFPFLGAVDFWAQFVFLGIFFIFFVVIIFRVPKLDEQQLDEDLEETEQEGLLAETGRRFGATWQDITGQAKGVKRADYGTAHNEEAGGS